MGREIKRVPMDFDFPIDSSWYDDHPYSVGCPEHKSPNYDEATDDEVECGNCVGYQPVPEGEGWQLWQTVSDGPISPVFATAEELVDFMCEPEPDPEKRGYPQWAHGYDRETAEAFVRAGCSAPSMMIVNGRGMTGVEYVAEEQRRKEGGD